MEAENYTKHFEEGSQRNKWSLKITQSTLRREVRGINGG